MLSLLPATDGDAVRELTESQRLLKQMVLNLVTVRSLRLRELCCGIP